MSRKYRSGQAAKNLESLNDDDNDDYDAANCEEGLSISASYYGGGKGSAVTGGPFSAILISMCPQNVLSTIKQIEESRQPDFRYDEFGFKVEVEDGPEEISSKILSIPFVEDPQSRLKWISFLEFSFNHVVEDLTWSKIDPLLPRSEKLASLVRAGVPHSLRPFIWPRLSGATLKRQQVNFTFQEIMKAATAEKSSVIKAIEKDLHRTLPTNACFMQMNGAGIVRLRRILLSIAYLYPDIGYCQGMGVIVGTFLLFLEEEDTFWMMVNLIEDLLPANYFGSSLLGVQADQKCLQHLIGNFLPEIEHLLRDHELELGLISLHWFLTLFSGVLHMKILLRIWDCFFYHGSTFLFQITLGMLRLNQQVLLKCDTSAQLFNVISNLPLTVEEADVLLDSAFSVAPSLNDSLIQTLRKKHMAYLMAEQGALLNPEADSNLPKQHINRRKLKRSQSFISQIFRPTSGQDIIADMEDIRMKNVLQTELLVDLKDSIMKVAKHFLAASQTDQVKAILQPDYSRESHKKDLELFMSGHNNRRKRARAMLDFERHDEDELGFRKNDIIIIVSQKDEHCWIGELNGLRGWFPAKFVELLDERTKSYSVAGDDAINEVISGKHKFHNLNCCKIRHKNSGRFQ